MLRTGFALNLLRQHLELPGHDHWSRDYLLARQNRSLHLLRQYAYAHSPFYKEFHKRLFERPLQELPVLTKGMMMEHFDRLVTDRSIHINDVESHLSSIKGRDLFLNKYWVNATSGSTGKRGVFLYSSKEWATLISALGRANLWAGSKLRLLFGKRIAAVASRAPWHLSFRIMMTLINPLVPLLRLDATEHTHSLVEALNAWRPMMLASYPSSLRALAKEQIEGRLRIRPQIIYAGGEVLSKDVRLLAMKAWEREVFDQYGTTETGNLAAECEHHRGLHINEDLIVAEVVDKDNHPTAAGHQGEKLLVTVLFNFTQPLIRYELSDRVKLAPALCRCGRPYRLIEEIGGREEEMLEFPSLAGGTIAIHPLALEHILDSAPASEWQIVLEPDRLLVLLSGVKEGYKQEVLAKSLEQELTMRGAIAPNVAVSQAPSIPRGRTGKRAIIKKA